MVMETLQQNQRRAIHVRDVTGSRRVTVEAGDDEGTIGELLESVATRMGTATMDSSGRPITWTMRSDRTGQRLHPSQTVADIQDGESVSLVPAIAAG